MNNDMNLNTNLIKHLDHDLKPRRRRQYCISGLVMLLLVSILWISVPSYAAASGWEQDGEDWYYYMSSGEPATGRMDIGGKRYVFSDEGKWYGTEGWVKSKGRWFYVCEDGQCCVTQRKIGDDWYSFSSPDGAMETGWIGTYREYYAGTDGRFVTGWKKINETWFRFSEYGKRMTGWTYSGGKIYYLKYAGGMMTGWQTIDDQKYYFNSEGELEKSDGVCRIVFTTNQKGARLSYGFSDVSTTEVVVMIPKGQPISVAYASADDMTLKGWKDSSGKIFTTLELQKLTATKDMVYTAVFVGTPTITYDPNGGKMHVNFGVGEETDYTGTFSIEYRKRVYEITEMTKKGYFFLGWYITEGTDAGAVIPKVDGFLVPDCDTRLKAVWGKAGWTQAGNNWLYTYKDGYQAYNIREIDGKKYLFGEDHVMKVGWAQDHLGNWYYAKKNGVLAELEWVNGYWFGYEGKWTYKPKGSWKKDKKGWWFGDTSGWYAKNDFVKIDGKNYFFKSSGYLASNEWCKGFWVDKNGVTTYEYGYWKKDENGRIRFATQKKNLKNLWQKIENKWYYFDQDGYVVTGTKEINGKVYQFTESGVCVNP